MIECFGCGHPMNHAWASHSTGWNVFHYCIVCEFWRKLKGISPGNHDKGTISNGTWTMRRRSR